MESPQTPQNNMQSSEYDALQVASPEMQQNIAENLPKQKVVIPQWRLLLASVLRQTNTLSLQLKSVFLKKTDSVVAQNEAQGFMLNKKEESGTLSFFDTLFLGKEDLIGFLDQLATLMGSGIRLVDSLVIMKQQAESAAMKKLLIQLIALVRNGQLLSQALASYPKLFPTKWTSLIHAGEKSGQLETILSDLAADETEQQKLHSALKGAMAYPSFVMILAVVLVVYMLMVVVPEIAVMYSKMHQKLPAPTLMMIAAAEFLQQFIWVMLAVIIGVVVSIKMAAAYISKIADALDWIKLRIPVLGELHNKQNIVLFAGNMSLLLRSGVLVVDALKIVKEVLPSRLYQQEVQRITEGVIMGKRMSQEMGLIDLQQEKFEHNNYFPLNVSQMIHIGEETGNLAIILGKMQVAYANKIQITIRTFSSLLEPFMIMFVGLMVGGILLAVMLPMFSMKV